MWTERLKKVFRPWLALSPVLLLLTGPVPAQDHAEPIAEDPVLQQRDAETGDDRSDRRDAEDEEAPLLDEEESLARRSYVSTSVLLGAARDDGFRAGDEELDDTVYRARPRLLLAHRPSERSELLIAYEPEIQVYDEHSGLDAVDHVAGFLAEHEPTRRSRILAGGSYLDGEDPGRQLGGLLLVLPRVPYTQWHGYAGYEYRWQRTALLLHGAYTSTSLDSGPGILGPGLEETAGSGTITLSRELTPRTDVVGSYSWIDPTYDTGLAFGDGTDETGLERLSEPFQTASLGFGHRPGPRLAFLVTGGVLDDRSEASDELSYIGSAELLRRGRDLTFRLRYDRSLFSVSPSTAPVGATPTTPASGAAPTTAFREVSQAVTVSLTGRLTPSLRWEQLLWGARTDLPNDQTLDSLAATSRLVWEMTRRLGTFVRAEYRDQRGSDLLGEPFTRTYVSIGLVVGLSGPPQSWGLRETPDALYRVLPYREGIPR